MRHPVQTRVALALVFLISSAWGDALAQEDTRAAEESDGEVESEPTWDQQIRMLAKRHRGSLSQRPADARSPERPSLRPSAVVGPRVWPPIPSIPRVKRPPARADDPREAELLVDAGLSLQLGAGVMSFIENDTREFTDAGGAWEARLVYGTRQLIGAELAYIGSAQEVQALGLDSSAALLGSGGEAAMRINVPAPRSIIPYALVGVGVTNYSLVNDEFNTSSLSDSETVLHVPLAAGLNIRAGRILIDLRGTLRPAFEDELVDDARTPIDEREFATGLDSWAVTAAGGVEF